MLEEFPFFFPELAHKKRYGMIATVIASKEVKQKVAEAGFLVLLTMNSLDCRNLRDFSLGRVIK
jgi:hypothetical protein